MKVKRTYHSLDGTIKYLLEVPGMNETIEAAFIKLPERRDDKPEYVLCLSSQLGCYYDCRMCANMFSSYKRNLSPNEINDQIETVLGEDGNLEKITKPGSVEYAFMGIGEPLFGNRVIRAISQHKPFVPDTRFSLSTVGATGSIQRLADSNLPYPVRLELSLHFSNDQLRNEWIRTDYLFRKRDSQLIIGDMIRESEIYLRRFGGKVTANYVIIDGINNTPGNISELVDLFSGRKGFYIKVMKPNHTSSFVDSWKDEFEDIETYTPEVFKELLERSGVEATLFESSGQDILAGCGMMRNRT